MHILPSLLLAALLAASGLASAASVITIINGNAAGVGFNDPTPVAPLPTNPGITLGEQRLIAFQYAADIWGANLDSVPIIRVLATFEPLTCTATTAVLGSAGPITVSSDFPNAIYPNTWYHAALANKLAGAVLDTSAQEIRARFNSSIGTPGCLTGSAWYLGRDTNAPVGQINLVTVLLHEFAHGLGFSSVTNVSTGVPLAGQSDAYSKFYFDTGLGLARDAMSDAQRQASAISGNVIWNGPNVTTAVPDVLDPGTPLLRVNAPGGIAGVYSVGTASFGAALSSPGVTADLVAALDAADGSGPSTFDACTIITNAAAVAGKIALVDRGTCGFTIKVKNVQDAGAIGAVVADNAAGSPPAGLGGADPTITIPAVRVTLADGTTLRTTLGSDTVNITLGVDLSIYAGANTGGFALLNSPNPVQPGSSISHWSPIAFPNQLMEPAINTDLTHSVKSPLDLTLPLLRDIGWAPFGGVVGCSPNPAQELATVTCTTTISGTNPSGYVTFTDNGAPVAGCVGVALAGSGDTKTATCTTAALSVGSHAIGSRYSGDRAGNPPGTSTVGAQVINPRPATTTTVASSGNPSAFGQSVSFTATITGSTPTGTVAFKDGAGNFPGCIARPVSGGAAVCTVHTLWIGSHAVTGVYSGDLNNAPSTSPVVNQAVNCVPGGRCP
jgi:hypothetical protein